MSITMPKLRNQAGDTIVEVLIVIIVIGVVITSSYQIAVASLRSIQLAQERTYALKLAEGQLENLKAASASKPEVIKTTSFCLDGSLTAKDINGIPASNAADDDFSKYNGCVEDPRSDGCKSYCYYYGIIPGASNNYTSSVRWEGADGTRKQVQLSYRVYK